MTETFYFYTRIDIPQISTNHAYPQLKTGRRILSKLGKEYKEYVWYKIKTDRKFNGIIRKPKRVSVVINYFFNDNRIRDVTGYDKILLDAMTGLVYDDDSQIIKILMTKTLIDKKQKAYTDIYVYLVDSQ